MVCNALRKSNGLPPPGMDPSPLKPHLRPPGPGGGPGGQILYWDTGLTEGLDPPRPGGGPGGPGGLMCQLASVEATYPKCGGGVPDPPPVVGKCATRTFSSNLYWASVLLALSRQNGQCYVSLISRGVRPGYSRAYISLYYVRAQSHALLARIMPARDIETRPRDVVTPCRGLCPPVPRPAGGCCTGTPALGCWMGRFTLVVWEGWGFPCSEWDTGGIWAAHSGPSPPASSIDCLPIPLDARSTLRIPQ